MINDNMALPGFSHALYRITEMSLNYFLGTPPGYIPKVYLTSDKELVKLQQCATSTNYFKK